MEADKCISTSSAATAQNQLIINDLDDYSLSMIFNKLPYVDRRHIESVCQRWYAVSKASWSTYSKRLRIENHFLPYGNTTENESILEKILQRTGPYLEEIIFQWVDRWRFPMGTIKWIAERCPKLKRLNTCNLMLNDDDWLACSNLEELSLSPLVCQQGDWLGILFRSNKRLRRLEVFNSMRLTARVFDQLDPGQLEFLQIGYCKYFEITAGVVDKLAESLVELKYRTFWSDRPNFQHLGKLKNLRSLDLKVRIELAEIKFIADVAKKCRKLECLFLAIYTEHAYDPNVFAPLFDLPYLRRLVIIVDENNVPSENQRDSLLQRAAHIEFFEIDTCQKCIFETTILNSCDRHFKNSLS